VNLPPLMLRPIVDTLPGDNRCPRLTPADATSTSASRSACAIFARRGLRHAPKRAVSVAFHTTSGGRLFEISSEPAYPTRLPCKQAEELQRAAKHLCDNLTERVDRTRALLDSSRASDRRKKAR
jgi:hypothetical protein